MCVFPDGYMHAVVLFESMHAGRHGRVVSSRYFFAWRIK